MKLFKVTLTEDQVRTIMHALELRFRLDLFQGAELEEILATLDNANFSTTNPNREKAFNSYIERRDHIGAVIEALFEIACPRSFRYSGKRERNMVALRAEEIWMTLRYALWTSSPSKDKNRYTVDSNPPLKISDQPIPKIEIINGD